MGGKADVAGQARAVAFRRQRHRVAGEVAPDRRGQPLQPRVQQVARRRAQGDHVAGPVVQPKGNVRVGHGDAVDELDRVGLLGARRFHELEPRRRRVKQIPDLDQGPPRPGGRNQLADRPGRRRRRWRRRRRPSSREATLRRDTDPIEGSASPRNPRVRICDRSSPSSFDVAWRSTASAKSSGPIPAPSSATETRLRPPSRKVMSIRLAPASRLFSTSSLTTEAGRSTTSPAAMRLTSVSGSLRMVMIHGLFDLFKRQAIKSQRGNHRREGGTRSDTREGGRSIAVPMACHRASLVLAAVSLRNALSFEKAISMGLKSGE